MRLSSCLKLSLTSAFQYVTCYYHQKVVVMHQKEVCQPPLNNKRRRMHRYQALVKRVWGCEIRCYYTNKKKHAKRKTIIAVLCVVWNSFQKKKERKCGAVQLCQAEFSLPRQSFQRMVKQFPVNIKLYFCLKFPSLSPVTPTGTLTSCFTKN